MRIFAATQKRYKIENFYIYIKELQKEKSFQIDCFQIDYWLHFWKKSMREKELSFYFIKLSWKRFFMKEFKWKIFTIAISPISRWKHSVFSVQIRIA